MKQLRKRNPPLPRLNLQRSRRLRRDLTEAEGRLWEQLRDRRLGNAKFRRQFPIGAYITDFCCFERRLIIELDGGQHAERVAEDQARTESLKAEGFRVMRFWNSDVLGATEVVAEEILRAIGEGVKTPSPSP